MGLCGSFGWPCLAPAPVGSLDPAFVPWRVRSRMCARLRCCRSVVVEALRRRRSVRGHCGHWLGLLAAVCGGWYARVGLGSFVSLMARPVWDCWLVRWVWAGVVGGVPSTLHAVVTRRDPLAAVRAAGALVLPGEKRSGVLVVAAVPVHFSVSLFWALVLARVLPRRHAGMWGAVAGVGIALFDLSLPGRRVAAVRSLPFWPQVVDHVVFGAVVGVYLRGHLSGCAQAGSVTSGRGATLPACA